MTLQITQYVVTAVALTAFGVMLLLLSAPWLYGKLRRCGLFFVFIAAGFLYSMATKPPTVRVYYDGGIKPGATANVVTNDTVAIYWQRDTSGGVYVPETATVYIDYRPNTATNEEWGLLAQTTVGAWGWSGTVENATNYDYNVWAYYIPPEPVHTNGVWTYKTHFDRNGEYALPLRARVEVNGVAIATPAAKRRDEHTYCRAGLLAMWDGINHGDNQLIWRDLSGNGYDATQRVANAGWHWDGDCYRGTSKNGHGFRAPQAIVDFFRSNITNHTVEIVYRPTASSRETILGQYYGSAVGLNIEYAPTLAGYFRVYWGAAPDFNSPAWKTLGMVRMTTTMLCNGTNCQIYENGAYKTQAAQPNVAKVGVQSLIIGGENSRSYMSIRGELCIVRIYSRALSADEIRHNYEIDKERFNLP